jgi:hypothetical protein
VLDTTPWTVWGVLDTALCTCETRDGGGELGGALACVEPPSPPLAVDLLAPRMPPVEPGLPVPDAGRCRVRAGGVEELRGGLVVP